MPVLSDTPAPRVALRFAAGAAAAVLLVTSASAARRGHVSAALVLRTAGLNHRSVDIGRPTAVEFANKKACLVDHQTTDTDRSTLQGGLSQEG